MASSGGAAVRSVWFRILLVAALGCVCSLVLVLLIGQLVFVGPVRPLAALAHGSVQSAVLLSVACATIAAVLAVVVATPAAYALARWRFPGQGIVDALVDVPIVLSPVALGVSLLLVLREMPGEWVKARIWFAGRIWP